MAESVIKKDKCATRQITVTFINSITNSAELFNIGDIVVSRGYIHISTAIQTGTNIATMSTNKPSMQQNILLIGTSGNSIPLTCKTDGNISTAAEIPVGYYTLR